MNILIQNILVILIFAIAIGFLIKKFFWRTSSTSSASKKPSNSCGSDGCGCH
ncbi:FeoB-associated Cys-rich membrane protein [Aquimarina longa]|uniref:FeoB-associated Cys-rich membrane protein n=1 Tax=Aquimarina longa TaxID=1080221 RepID=UPI0011E03A03|nr:FeoB-associated Cys-rich membrane protein [Aquimarina longa]